MKLKEGKNKEDIVFITLARCQVTFEKTAKEKKNLKLTETQNGVAWLPSERRSLRPSFLAPLTVFSHIYQIINNLLDILESV
jgi:hypothetical protein